MNPSPPPSGGTTTEANEKQNSHSKGKKSIHRNERGDPSWRTYSNQWKTNHGTMILAFTGLIWLVGSALLFYRQNRFRPPSFPTSKALQQPAQSDLLNPELNAEIQDEESVDAAGRPETLEATQDQASRGLQSDTSPKARPNAKSGKSGSSTDAKMKKAGKPGSQDQSHSRLRMLDSRKQTVFTKAASPSTMRLL